MSDSLSDGDDENVRARRLAHGTRKDCEDAGTVRCEPERKRLYKTPKSNTRNRNLSTFCPRNAVSCI
eukprot:3110389-Rhodomonas_salina.1